MKFAHHLDTGFGAKDLKGWGRTIFEVIDPEAAERLEGAQLARQERDAARKTYLSMFDDGEGTVTGGSRSPPCTRRC